MRKVKTDNSDLIQYLDTVKELKNYIPIEEYRNEYRKLCSDNIPWIKIKNLSLPIPNFADWIKKRESLIELFIDELNPISSSTARTAAKSSGNFDVLYERMLYSKTLSEKKVMKKLLPWSLNSVQKLLWSFSVLLNRALSNSPAFRQEFKPSSQIRRKMPL